MTTEYVTLTPAPAKETFTTLLGEVSGVRVARGSDASGRARVVLTISATEADVVARRPSVRAFVV